MPPVLVVARLTVQEASRRRLLLALVILTLIVVGFSAWGFHKITELAQAGEAQLISSQLLIVVTFMFSGVLALSAAVVAGPLISSEVESGLLLAVLARPVRRSEIVIGKWLGLAVLVAIYAGAAGLLEMLAVDWATGYVPPHPIQLIVYVAVEGLALLSLGDLYEQVKKPDLAIKAYERIPASSVLARNAQIQMAVDLDALERTEEAKKLLERVIAERPRDTEAIVELGNIQRARKNFADCAETYGKAIDTVPNPEKANWVMFYFRGICYERSHQWPSAEADMKKALSLYTDQPLVLNYLGYSWVDQGVHMDEGMDMIRRAVEQRPDDGYIVDSLGWAYYRIGNYDEAVKNLERAVELKPEDPTINDHLGDAYWRIGRTLEAHFQWSHAKDLNPDPEELPKIEAKLKEGLRAETSSAASAAAADKPSSAADAEKAKKSGDGG